MPDVTGCKRILVVDDAPNVSKTLVMILRNAGYEAIAVPSAEEALALIPTWMPQEAILDVDLPGMHGIDLAIRLKAEYPTIRLTILSGHTATTDRLEKAREDGHRLKALPKPIHPSELLRVLAETSSDQSQSELKHLQAGIGAPTDSAT